MRLTALFLSLALTVSLRAADAPPLLLQILRYLTTKQDAPRYEACRPTRLPNSGSWSMPRILIGIIRNRGGSQTNDDFTDTLPQILKVLMLLWGACEKLVV